MATHPSAASAGFHANLNSVPAPAAETVYCFSILAEAEPGVMPRVLELFARRGLTPARWHSDVIGKDRRELSIDVQVNGLDVAAGDYIARCLRQVHQVETVLTSQKHLVAARPERG